MTAPPPLPVHTIASAPDACRATLEEVAQTYGFVPNLLGMLGNAPAALHGYLALSRQFAGASLPAAAREVVLLTASRANGCRYCVAAHSLGAQAHLTAADVAALREERPLATPALEVVRQLTQAVVVERGQPPAPLVAAFLAAGYTPAQLLEVVVGVALKTLSNYANHLAHTPLDEVMAAARWEPPAR